MDTNNIDCFDGIKQTVFWGATGQAKVLKECVSHYDLEVVALFDNNTKISSPFDIPLFLGREGFEKWFKTRNLQMALGFLVAIGGDKGKERLKLQKYLEDFGLTPIRIKHPTAFVAHNAKIGSGSQILANSSICVECEIGRGCIINTGASVDHECRLGDGVHIGPGVHLAGCIEVGQYATIYTGAVVLPRIKIGENSVIGAGSVVLKDVPANVVVAGNPAKIIRNLTIERSCK